MTFCFAHTREFFFFPSPRESPPCRSHKQKIKGDRVSRWNHRPEPTKRDCSQDPWRFSPPQSNYRASSRQNLEPLSFNVLWPTFWNEMEGDSRPSSVSSLEQVMRFQPQSIKLMERLDKNLLSSRGAAGSSAAPPPGGRRLVSPPGRNRP